MIHGIVSGRKTVGGATDPNFATVRALLHFDGVDASSTMTDVKGHTFTSFGGAELDTFAKRFGPSSLLLNGTTGYVESPHHADWDFGSSSFTLECWVMPRIAVTTRMELCNRFNVTGWGMQIMDTGLLRGFIANTTSGTVLVSGATTVTHNQWHHTALVRDGTTLRLFLDGVSQATATINGSVDPIVRILTIGRDAAGNNRFLDGWIDEVRISTMARYTSNFTPEGPFANS